MERMLLAEKGERIDSLYGRDDFVLTDEDIEELKKGKRLYAEINYEYVVVLNYRKEKNEGDINS